MVNREIRDMSTTLIITKDMLEVKSRENEAVATALLNDKSKRWSTRHTVFVVAVASTSLVLNVLALGPDLIHRWAG